MRWKVSPSLLPRKTRRDERREYGARRNDCATKSRLRSASTNKPNTIARCHPPALREAKTHSTKRGARDVRWRSKRLFVTQWRAAPQAAREHDEFGRLDRALPL